MPCQQKGASLVHGELVEKLLAKYNHFYAMPYCEQQEKIRHIVIFPFPKKIQIIHMFLKTNAPNHQ